MEHGDRDAMPANTRDHISGYPPEALPTHLRETHGMTIAPRLGLRIYDREHTDAHIRLERKRDALEGWCNFHQAIERDGGTSPNRHDHLKRVAPR